MKPGMIVKRTFQPFILLGLIWLFASGCASGHTATANNRVQADKLLADALSTMQKIKSYRYTGTGAIQYIGIDDSGTFSLVGAYKSPRQSYLRLEMKLGGSGYHSEIIYRNLTFYQLANESWKIVPFSSDTLMQPGYKPVNLLLDQLSTVSSGPVLGTYEYLGGRKVTVIRIESNSRKLKTYLQKQFDTAARLEPDRRAGLMNFLRSCTPSEQYTLYIDPPTKQVVRLLFRQNIKITQLNHTAENKLSIDYTLAGFGTKIDLPSIKGTD